ncbi:MAG: hypothetical protein AB2L14_01850 [Candidatus Xenobiia bacterium LiM19]
MKPDLLQFEGEFRTKMNIVKVDVNNEDSAEYKGYSSLSTSEYVPHIILIDNSRKTLKQHTGAMSKEQLIDFVKPYVK